MNLVMFGCSLTRVCGIPQYFTQQGFSVLDFSESAGSNRLQIQRYYDWIEHTPIDRDDVLIWQITGFERPWARLDRRQFLENPSRYIPADLSPQHHCHVENQHTVDLLSNADYTHARPEYVTLDQLLSFFRHLIPQHKLLIWAGHEGFVRNHQDRLIALATDHVYFCQEYFTNWCWQRRLPFQDQAHPAVESGQTFADLCLRPLVDKLAPIV